MKLVLLSGLLGKSVQTLQNSYLSLHWAIPFGIHYPPPSPPPIDGVPLFVVIQK